VKFIMFGLGWILPVMLLEFGGWFYRFCDFDRPS